jgi:protein-S-isoprenylcysteine O-methyltransferase Ste14
VWARRHLGRNWSASVVVKEGHALVRTGPYQYVRHPIYSGILLAFLGIVVTIGECADSWRCCSPGCRSR